MTDPEVQPLNSLESEWIESNISLASQLAHKYAGQSEALPSLPLLGTILAAWGAAPGDGREDANTVVNALGLAFGQHLVDRLRLSWAVVSDENGTDIAVHGSPGNILVFPTNATAKRVAERDYDFFARLFEDLSRDISRMRSSWS